MNATTQNKSELMKTLSQAEFAVIETALFLDSHPEDKKALSYYNSMIEERDKLRAQYVQLYGPLTIYDNNDNSNWAWIKGPWPWELED